MKTTVVYHSADFDGLFCREIARKFLPDAELIGWDFGDPPVKVPLPSENSFQLYIMDLPIDRVLGLNKATSHAVFGIAPNIVWIDHHKSAIESHAADIPGYRIDGVAACRLAWQYFSLNSQSELVVEVPAKPRFVNREVKEPLAVRLAGEYDIWDQRDPDAELFQHGLRSQDLEGWWEAMLSDEATATVAEIENRLEQGSKFELMPNGNIKVPGLGDRVVGRLLKRGEAIQYAKLKENESIIQSQSFRMEWEGLRWLCCNHARFNSHLFTAGLMEDDDACLGFAWKCDKWMVSLYHAPGNEHHDLSLIAVKHGGGGHRGACGFTCETLPFNLAK